MMLRGGGGVKLEVNIGGASDGIPGGAMPTVLSSVLQPSSVCEDGNFAHGYDVGSW